MPTAPSSPTAASTEQAAGVEEVTRAVAQMDEATQQNAALVEAGAAATESLSGHAATLMQLLSFFSFSARSARRRALGTHAAAPARRAG